MSRAGRASSFSTVSKPTRSASASSLSAMSPYLPSSAPPLCRSNFRSRACGADACASATSVIPTCETTFRNPRSAAGSSEAASATDWNKSACSAARSTVAASGASRGSGSPANSPSRSVRRSSARRPSRPRVAAAKRSMISSAPARVTQFRVIGRVQSAVHRISSPARLVSRTHNHRPSQQRTIVRVRAATTTTRADGLGRDE
jgi:hypothetical protein